MKKLLILLVYLLPFFAIGQDEAIKEPWVISDKGNATTLNGQAYDTAGVIINSVWKYNPVSGEWEIGVDNTGGDAATTDYRDFNEILTIGNPLAGIHRLWIHTAGKVMIQNSAGDIDSLATEAQIIILQDTNAAQRVNINLNTTNISKLDDSVTIHREDINALIALNADISYGESYVANYRDKVLDDGGTYYPNTSGYTVGKLKSADILNKAVALWTASAGKLQTIYSIKNFDDAQIDVAASTIRSRVTADGFVKNEAVDMPRIDYTAGDAVINIEDATTQLITTPETFSSFTVSGVTIEGDASTAGSDLINLDFTTDWATLGAGTTIVDANNFTTQSGQGIWNTIGLVEGTMYTIHIKGTQPAGGYINIISGTTGISITGDITDDSFDLTGDFTWGANAGIGDLFIKYNSGSIGDNIYVETFTIQEVSGFTSPSADGYEAFKLVESSVDEQHFINSDLVQFTSGEKFTYSVYAKYDGVRKWLFIRPNLTSRSSAMGYFNLETGETGTVIGSAELNITHIVNGWYRCELTGLGASTATTQMKMFMSDEDAGSAAPSYLGDGSTISIFGANFTQTDYAHAFIYAGVEGSPITTSSDAITGAGDATLFSGVNSSGVLFAEIAAFTETASTRSMSLYKDINNYVSIRYTSSINEIKAVVTVGGIITANIDYTVTSTLDFHKVAVLWNSTGASLYIDGAVVGPPSTTNSSFPASTITTFSFATGGTTSNPFYGKYQQGGVYTELTDAELVTLTTP